LQLVRHRGPRLQVIAQLRLEALIYAIEPKSGDQRREPAMHECGVIDHDEERLGEQPCAVAPGGRKCLRVREITWGKIRVEVHARRGWLPRLDALPNLFAELRILVPGIRGV